MHWLIPYASPLSDSGRAALAGLALPHLERLLARWNETRRDVDAETSLSPPHERALARHLGWPVDDGRLPWAARRAAAAGLDADRHAWGELTPVHWQVGTDQVSLVDPDALDLAEPEARALFEAARPVWEAEGATLHWLATGSWLVAHDSLEGIASASLDRAIGRHVGAWLPPRDDPAARRLWRLQNEVQMLWHDHPVNQAREAAGQLPVNSLWLSGCGSHQPARETPPLQVDDALRRAALGEDWAAWQRAWQALDDTLLPRALAAGSNARVTMCGERAAVELASGAAGWRQRVAAWTRRVSAPDWLATL